MTNRHIRYKTGINITMDDFLNSKAMMTPAISGTAVTIITAILVSHFGLPGNWCVLGLSLALGLLTWADKAVPVVQRMVLYLINSSTIMVFAIGLNQAGMAASGYDNKLNCPEIVERNIKRGEKPASEKFFQPWF
jgi:hypothetical protein